MAVTDVVSLDEFVDLYKILEISPDASESELRERVNKLYLEAQRNLDHHNFRKRFYYQQLYEIHLPQAHQLLLNPGQRSEYDRFLDCFNKGLPFPDEERPTHSGPTGGELGRADQIATDVLPTAGGKDSASSSSAVSPLASPTSGGVSTEPQTPVAPAKKLSTSGRGAASDSSSTISGGARPAIASPATTAGTPIIPRPAPAWRRQVMVDASEVERRRDYKRRELIKGELVAAGLTWGWSIGLAAFLVLGAMLFFVLNLLKLSSSSNFIIGGVAVVAALAVVAGRYALREARRRIVVVLSKMPYDELLRRCAK